MKNAFFILAVLAMLWGCGQEVTGGTPTERATALSVGDNHSCVVVTGGVIKCWGLNSSGQIGDSTPLNALTASTVVNISNAAAVSAGGAHTCALLTGGAINCWGLNSEGQLGDSSTASSFTPVSVTGITNASRVSAGGDHTCAVLTDGTVWCWGRNISGQLGNGGAANSSVPIQVPGISTATDVAAGGDHTCALLTNGTVLCWGANLLGQLGNSSTALSRIPVSASGVTLARQISSRANHTCATLSTGLVQCWGDNSTGQTGVFWTTVGVFPVVTITTSQTPVTVPNISGASGVSAGGDHTCAVLGNNTVRCWGDNFAGQLGSLITTGIPPGFGAPATSTITPLAVLDISTAAEVGAGLTHTCARLSSGDVRCWGRGNFGQLGNGNGVSSPVPVTVID